MKYELETIPIWDTYTTKPHCPLCTLEKKAENTYIGFFLGNSVMNPEMRVQVNRTGFCPDHFAGLYNRGENRHGLGLITQTHLKQVREKLSLGKQAGVVRGSAKKLTALLKKLIKIEEQCMICDRIENTLKRYAFTIAHLWKKDSSFREKYSRSQGICLHHLPILLSMSQEALRGKKKEEFIRTTLELTDKYLEKAEKDLLVFTAKYGFEKAYESWGEERFALITSIQKLTGKLLKIQYIIDNTKAHGD